ncbi:alpha-tocopherol transfer protein-like [Zophobas morio]
MALPFTFQAQTIIAEGRTSQIDVDRIRNWLQTSMLPQLQDEFIAIFLISSENKVDKTKQIIEAYFRIKNGFPHIFNNIDVHSEQIKNIQKVLGLCIVPNRMDTNSVVICAKLIDTNYRSFELIAALKLSFSHLHLMQIENPPNDCVLVFDMKGVGFMHMTCLKMEVVVTYLKYIQEALPLKIRAIHILNSNYIFSRILDLFKMFMKSELLTLFHTHSSGMKLEKFHEEWVPAACLPKEYGGEVSFEKLMNQTKKGIKEIQPFLDAEEQLRKCI